ncbi:FAD:protein FMN transferase [Dyadobacter tibetensis]|uniref:FAD:protein FMN transferase n=1 Tax=Dyadobacter tibetensis TaxID=1211851 RepID=UPI0004725551|nr:FAD:protein FMN transferase [Dyadobacter tibetensis]
MYFSKFTSLIFACCLSIQGKAQENFVSLYGETQGTTYQVKYYDGEKRNFQTKLDSILCAFDACLSLYRPDSELSRFNREISHRFESPYFYPVLAKSKEIFDLSGGVYDPTILPLVEAYGFGPAGKHQIQPIDLDSILPLVDFNHIQFDTATVTKKHQAVRLDFNGIAQGYAVDLLSMFLERQGITRYMVEIGGEIRCGGRKDDNISWMAGIEDPTKPGRLIATIPIEDRAMTTSGNYRNHFTKNGRRYNHIINPRNGDMETSNILSVTVLAHDAITADGLDTPFFLMDLETVKSFVEERDDLDIFIVYSDPDKGICTYASTGIRSIIRSKIP